MAPGDLIRNPDLQPLRVLAAEVDTTPRMVHNLDFRARQIQCRPDPPDAGTEHLER